MKRAWHDMVLPCPHKLTNQIVCPLLVEGGNSITLSLCCALHWVSVVYFCGILDQILDLILTQICINYCSNRVGIHTHMYWGKDKPMATKRAVMKPVKRMTLTRTMHEKIVIMLYGTEQSMAFCPPSFNTQILTCSIAKAPVALMAWGWKSLCPCVVTPECWLMLWEWLDSPPKKKKKHRNVNFEWQFFYSKPYPVFPDSDKAADNKMDTFLPEAQRSKITELLHVYEWLMWKLMRL